MKTPEQLAADIKAWGRELGFQQVGITDVDPGVNADHLHTWLEHGYHGEMNYMQRHAELRAQAVELQRLESRVSQLGVRVEREVQLREERERAAAALNEVESRLKELRASRKKMAGADERFDEAERIEKLLRTPAVRRDLHRPDDDE